MIQKIGTGTKRLAKWFVGVSVVAALIYVLAMSSRRSEEGRLGQAYPIQGTQHVVVGVSHPDYNSNPPTSGWHYAAPAEWGVHESELPDEQVVHNLEHGGIWISYKGIDAAAKAQLEKIVRSNSGVILTPRQANDASVTLASWGRLQKLESFDEAAILNFIRANKNKSPEPFAP